MDAEDLLRTERSGGERSSDQASPEAKGMGK